MEIDKWKGINCIRLQKPVLIMLHSIMYMGTCLRKNWDIPGQNDFQVEPCEKFYLGEYDGLPMPIRNKNYIVTDEKIIEKAQKLY